MSVLTFIILKNLFEPRHKPAGKCAVDEAMVVRERDEHHRFAGDDIAFGSFDDDRALLDGSGAKDSDLRLINNGRR